MATRRFLGALALLPLLLALQARQPLPLHRRMNLEQLKRTFHVDDYDQVPPYEVVRVRGGVSKRSAAAPRRVRLSAFGRELRLNLRQNREFEERLKSMKMYTAESTGNGIEYKEMPLEDDDPSTTYHDLEQMAAVTIRHGTDGKIQMEGTIGEELVVRPVPAALLVDDQMFLDEDGEGAGHVVFRGQGPPNGSDFAPLDAPWSDRPSGARLRREAAPASVWPEILLLVDHGSFVLHGLSSRHIKRYFVSFWNGVDLRYKTLLNPKIRISLAGIIVAKSKEATPYLERNRLPQPNRDAVDAAAALTDLGKYLYLEDRLPAYDMAVVMTKLDMCRKNFGGGRCSRGTAGFAYVGGACVVNKRLEKVNSVAIIEDSGGFSGIIVAAHEVGHLLGCVHDGSPPPSYLGGPGASRCPWEDGFIMSDLRHTDRGFKWSACSVEQFKHFLHGETASCLRNYPDDNKLLARELPGAMLTLDAQCERDRGSQACFKDSRVCAQLFCYDNDSGYCVSFRPAAEGSPCGDGQVCKNGKCIVDNENIIPDYTHVTRSIANRMDKEPSQSTPPPQETRPRHRPPSFTGRSQKKEVPTTTEENAGCEDAVERLAGGLSCRQFLQRYGDRYCRHGYMTRNCCRSHGAVCGLVARQ